jgi:hypothetical protein
VGLHTASNGIVKYIGIFSVASERVEVLAAHARGAGPRMTRRIVVLEQAHFTIEGLPTQHWELVVMDLNTKTGELFCQVITAVDLHSLSWCWSSKT